MSCHASPSAALPKPSEKGRMGTPLLCRMFGDALYLHLCGLEMDPRGERYAPSAFCALAVGVVDFSGAARQNACPGSKQAQGLQKAMQPSADLATIVGREPLPHTEITKKLRDYIKAHDLHDAQNKRQINADA